MDFIYDGSIEHLFSTFFDAYNKGPVRIYKDDNGSCLFERELIKLDHDKFLRIKNYIEKKASKSFYLSFLYVFQSSNEYKEEAMLEILRMLEKYGSKAVYCENKLCILFRKLEREVSRERHAYLGLTRFNTLEDKTLYAKIRPENNILPLIISHFVKRLPEEKFIIHDVGRNTAFSYNEHKLEYLSDADFLSDIKKGKDNIKEYWKIFYKHISIDERKNEKLRISNMPKRYWEFLSELEEE